jgi:hypothetical protein
MEAHLRAKNLRVLVALLDRLPASRVISTSEDADNEAAEIAELLRQETGADEVPTPSDRWWVKLQIDIRSHMAWHVVHELGSSSTPSRLLALGDRVDRRRRRSGVHRRGARGSIA